MNIHSLRTIAHKSGVFQPEHIFSEQQLVRSIQVSQGRTPCFQSDLRYFCKKKNCGWRNECKKLIAEWMR